MEIIEYKGQLYHLAKDIREWRKTIKKRRQDLGMTITNMTAHHIIAQRSSLLGRIVENGIMVPNYIHALQKSTDPKDRKKLDNYVVKIIGEEKWKALVDLGRYLKYQDPGGWKIRREK